MVIQWGISSGANNRKVTLNRSMSNASYSLHGSIFATGATGDWSVVFNNVTKSSFNILTVNTTRWLVVGY